MKGELLVAEDTMPLLELLRKGGTEVDFLKEAVKQLVQQLMEAEVTNLVGAAPYERSENRLVQRNGYREREWDTRAGTIPLRIPKLRSGSYFPWFLEPRKRAERAILSVVQEAYVLGVSTRKVDDLVQAMGLEGVDKSQVSRICKELDGMVNEWRRRPLEGTYPYVWLDATYLKVRESGRVVSMALVVAIAVRDSGEREVLGIEMGAAENETFWKEFLRSLVARGLKGLQLVISDAHEGLKKAIRAVCHGASWQRCRVHFMRNILGQVPKSAQTVVTAAVRTIFQQPDSKSAHATLDDIAKRLDKKYPKVSVMLRESAEDVLAFMSFPQDHWRQLHSTNPLERLNKEIKRRSNVVGIFPNRPSALRLVGALLMEQEDEWATGRRYFSQESMRKLGGDEAIAPEVDLDVGLANPQSPALTGSGKGGVKV